MERGLIIMVALLLTACVVPQKIEERPNSTLTQGNVQLNVKVGETTKAKVLEVFGAPNVTTRDGAGREVWTYQRSARVARSAQESDYFSIIILGRSASNSGFEETSRMITLIIKFDENDVVADFRSRASSF